MMQPANDARIREITARLVAALAPERVLVLLSFMADPKETVVSEWMVKAERDLASAPGRRHDGDGRSAKKGACLFAISGCNV